MYCQRWFPRSILLAPAVALLAACNDGGTGPDRLTRDEVGGNYQICSLTFTPAGGFIPALSIRDSVMNTAPDADTPARLAIGLQSQDFQLRYTRRNDVIQETFPGTYRLGSSTVTLSFDDPAAEIASALLLPTTLELDFDDSPKSLTITAGLTNHQVSRENYEAVAGQTVANLPPQIEGTLSGRFVATGTACQ